MARIRSITGEMRIDLTQGWQMCESAAGRWRDPQDAAREGDWLPALVPGTAAAALAAVGRFDRAAPRPLHPNDFWYRTALTGQGARRLVFEGLATLCDVWLDGVRIASSESMFVPLECRVTLAGDSVLMLHFKAFAAENLPPPARRQRWRPHLVADPEMRGLRSALFGHMPGWCPDIDPVGPWRPVRLIADGPVTAQDADVRAGLDGTDGVLHVSLALGGAAPPALLCCAGVEAPLQPCADGRFTARLHIPDVPLWWPHTHGEPALHVVTIRAGTTEIDLGKVGFRSISVDSGPDDSAFALIVNGSRIFCRGANWTTPDLLSLPQAREACLPLLELARAAGMNMLRVSGIMAGESDAFFDLLDAFGILCWEDMRFANFDYPFEDDPFGTIARAEIEAFLDRTQTSPALAVVCGGSEIAQQAAMLSLPRPRWTIPFLEETLTGLVAARRPDLIAVPHSPWGGALPFVADQGVTHYYGVGAYCQPLEDARRANVSFATECLAFANLPQPAVMARDHAGLDPASADWKGLVVRDLKATWDFEDTRDYYLDLLYGMDAAALKRADAARYIALSQAVSGEVMEATLAEWRRAGSRTGGALVWLLSDIGPGFGWGVIDADGRPKPVYYALKRAFRPVTVVLTDEGVNGLHLHAINDSAAPVAARLTLACLAADGSTVIEGQCDLDLAPRSAQSRSATDLFGVFFDTTYAYRFGPPAHVASVARLTRRNDPDPALPVAEAIHFPLGRGSVHEGLVRSLRSLGIAPPDADWARDPGVTTGLTRDGEGWTLTLRTERLAQSLHIDCPGYRPDDDWFHLAPGLEKRVKLQPFGTAPAARGPNGSVRTLSGHLRPFGLDADADNISPLR